MTHSGQSLHSIKTPNRWRGEEAHSDDFDSIANVVLPGDTEHVGQVEGEVDDSPAGGGQVCSGERSADEETLHDGDDCVGSQEEEDDARVTVRQQVSLLYRTQ